MMNAFTDFPLHDEIQNIFLDITRMLKIRCSEQLPVPGDNFEPNKLDPVSVSTLSASATSSANFMSEESELNKSVFGKKASCRRDLSVIPLPKGLFEYPKTIEEWTAHSESIANKIISFWRTDSTRLTPAKANAVASFSVPQAKIELMSILADYWYQMQKAVSFHRNALEMRMSHLASSKKSISTQSTRNEPEKKYDTQDEENETSSDASELARTNMVDFDPATVLANAIHDLRKQQTGYIKNYNKIVALKEASKTKKTTSSNSPKFAKDNTKKNDTDDPCFEAQINQFLCLEATRVMQNCQLSVFCCALRNSTICEIRKMSQFCNETEQIEAEQAPPYVRMQPLEFIERFEHLASVYFVSPKIDEVQGWSLAHRSNKLFKFLFPHFILFPRTSVFPASSQKTSFGSTTLSESQHIKPDQKTEKDTNAFAEPVLQDTAQSEPTHDLNGWPDAYYGPPLLVQSTQSAVFSAYPSASLGAAGPDPTLFKHFDDEASATREVQISSVNIDFLVRKAHSLISCDDVAVVTSSLQKLQNSSLSQVKLSTLGTDDNVRRYYFGSELVRGRSSEMASYLDMHSGASNIEQFTEKRQILARRSKPHETKIGYSSQNLKQDCFDENIVLDIDFAQASDPMRPLFAPHEIMTYIELRHIRARELRYILFRQLNFFCSVFAVAESLFNESAGDSCPAHMDPVIFGKWPSAHSIVPHDTVVWDPRIDLTSRLSSISRGKKSLPKYTSVNGRIYAVDENGNNVVFSQAYAEIEQSDLRMMRIASIIVESDASKKAASILSLKNEDNNNSTSGTFVTNPANNIPEGKKPHETIESQEIAQPVLSDSTSLLKKKSLECDRAQIITDVLEAEVLYNNSKIELICILLEIAFNTLDSECRAKLTRRIKFLVHKKSPFEPANCCNLSSVHRAVQRFDIQKDCITSIFKHLVSKINSSSSKEPKCAFFSTLVEEYSCTQIIKGLDRVTDVFDICNALAVDLCIYTDATKNTKNHSHQDAQNRTGLLPLDLAEIAVWRSALEIWNHCVGTEFKVSPTESAIAFQINSLTSLKTVAAIENMGIEKKALLRAYTSLYEAYTECVFLDARLRKEPRIPDSPMDLMDSTAASKILNQDLPPQVAASLPSNVDHTQATATLLTSTNSSNLSSCSKSPKKFQISGCKLAIAQLSRAWCSEIYTPLAKNSQLAVESLKNLIIAAAELQKVEAEIYQVSLEYENMFISDQSNQQGLGKQTVRSKTHWKSAGTMYAFFKFGLAHQAVEIASHGIEDPASSIQELVKQVRAALSPVQLLIQLCKYTVCIPDVFFDQKASFLGFLRNKQSGYIPESPSPTSPLSPTSSDAPGDLTSQPTTPTNIDNVVENVAGDGGSMSNDADLVISLSSNVAISLWARPSIDHFMDLVTPETCANTECKETFAMRELLSIYTFAKECVHLLQAASVLAYGAPRTALGSPSSPRSLNSGQSGTASSVMQMLRNQAQCVSAGARGNRLESVRSYFALAFGNFGMRLTVASLGASVFVLRNANEAIDVSLAKDILSYAYQLTKEKSSASSLTLPCTVFQKTSVFSPWPDFAFRMPLKNTKIFWEQLNEVDTALRDQGAQNFDTLEQNTVLGAARSKCRDTSAAEVLDGMSHGFERCSDILRLHLQRLEYYSVLSNRAAITISTVPLLRSQFNVKIVTQVAKQCNSDVQRHTNNHISCHEDEDKVTCSLDSSMQKAENSEQNDIECDAGAMALVLRKAERERLAQETMQEYLTAVRKGASRYLQALLEERSDTLIGANQRFVLPVVYGNQIANKYVTREDFILKSASFKRIVESWLGDSAHIFEDKDTESAKCTCGNGFQKKDVQGLLADLSEAMLKWAQNRINDLERVNADLVNTMSSMIIKQRGVIAAHSVDTAVQSRILKHKIMLAASEKSIGVAMDLTKAMAELTELRRMYERQETVLRQELRVRTETLLASHREKMAKVASGVHEFRVSIVEQMAQIVSEVKRDELAAMALRHQGTQKMRDLHVALQSAEERAAAFEKTANEYRSVLSKHRAMQRFKDAVWRRVHHAQQCTAETDRRQSERRQWESAAEWSARENIVRQKLVQSEIKLETVQNEAKAAQAALAQEQERCKQLAAKLEQREQRARARQCAEVRAQGEANQHRAIEFDRVVSENTRLKRENAALRAELEHARGVVQAQDWIEAVRNRLRPRSSSSARHRSRTLSSTQSTATTTSNTTSDNSAD